MTLQTLQVIYFVTEQDSCNADTVAALTVLLLSLTSTIKVALPVRFTSTKNKHSNVRMTICGLEVEKNENTFNFRIVLWPAVKRGSKR